MTPMQEPRENNVPEVSYLNFYGIDYDDYSAIQCDGVNENHTVI